MHAFFGKQRASDKKPLKVNIFESMLGHQGMLEQIPLFPYFGPGDIVPTAALSISLPDMPRIHFYHYNDVPEIILTMASEGALIATGQLYLQQGTHGVTTFLRAPKADEARSYQISFIIVRMKKQGPQMEGFILRCADCNEIVYRMDRDIWQGAGRDGGSRPQTPGHRYYPELANVRFYADAADDFNAQPRVCGKCGSHQPRFPTEVVGWRRYVQYAELANRARAALEMSRAAS